MSESTINLFELVNNVDVLASTYVNGHLQPFLIIGPPGIAKTTVIEGAFAKAWAKFAKKKVSVLNFVLSNMEPPDVMGLPIVDRADPEYPCYRYAMPNIIAQIRKAPTYKDGLVLVNLDEFTKCDSSMQKVASDFVYNYRIGEYGIPDNVWIVMTGNRMQDNSGETRQHAMLTNRMPIFNVELPNKAWVSYARSIDLPPTCISFAERFPDTFVTATPPRSGAFCTPRSFTGLAKYLKSYNERHGKPLAHVEDNVFTRNLAYGMIGEAAALEFYAYAKVADAIPSTEDILNNPLTAPVPGIGQIDAQYAVVNLAVSMALRNPLDAPAAIKYLLRIPTIELVARAIIDLNTATGSVTMNNPDASAWLARNKLLIADANIG